MQIIKDIRNDLLKRNEITALVEAEKNPGFDEMKKQVSEQVGKSGENIEVFNIKGSFGSKEFKINANVYDSKEDLEKNKMKTKKQRKAEKKGESEKKEEAEVEKPVDTGASAEDKPEQIEQEVKTEEKPSEAPAEDKPEEEAKAVKEEKQAEGETKEN